MSKALCSLVVLVGAMTAAAAPAEAQEMKYTYDPFKYQLKFTPLQYVTYTYDLQVGQVTGVTTLSGGIRRITLRTTAGTYYNVDFITGSVSGLTPMHQTPRELMAVMAEAFRDYSNVYSSLTIHNVVRPSTYAWYVAAHRGTRAILTVGDPPIIDGGRSTEGGLVRAEVYDGVTENTGGHTFGAFGFATLRRHSGSDKKYFLLRSAGTTALAPIDHAGAVTFMDQLMDDRPWLQVTSSERLGTSTDRVVHLGSGWSRD